MSRPSLAFAILMIAVPAAAQTTGAAPAAPAAAAPAAAPRNGLEANGLNYQPTQGGTVSKEEAAGVRPSVQHQEKTDSELNQIDRQLLQSEGKNPSNAVNPAPH